jgi:hypothetical protein
MLKNFKKGFNGDYGVKLTPSKLRTFSEIHWPAFGIGWPLERSSNKVTFNSIFEVVVGELGHPDKFPYIDCWQDTVLSWPMRLKPHLEEACRIMVARVAGASKPRGKCKKPEKHILAGDPEETLSYVPLYSPVTTFCPFASTLRRGSSSRQGSASNKCTYKARPRSS